MNVKLQCGELASLSPLTQSVVKSLIRLFFLIFSGHFVVSLTVQEFRRKGALNAMNVFSNLSATSDRPEPPYDKSGDESRSVCVSG